MADLLGGEFVKLFVCFHNKWNPYSAFAESLPDMYWFLQFQFIQLERKQTWEHFLLPTAEMAGQIANPEVFKVYYDHKKAREKENKRKKDSKNAINDSGEMRVVNKSGDSINEYVESEANSHFDPEKGLVDNEGRILIPKEQYEKLIGLDGIAISY